MSAKPIFIIGVPTDCGDNRTELFDHWTEMAKIISEDYHTVVHDVSGYEVTFRVFSDHEIEPIELEKLKSIVSGK